MANTSIAFAQINDFTGGLNYRADQFQLAPNESPNILNMEIDPRGGLFTRAGYEPKSTSAVSFLNNVQKFRNLFAFQASTPYIMMSFGYPAASGTTSCGFIYKSTGGAFTKLQSSTSSADIPVYHEFGASFAQWEDTLYFTTGISSGGTTGSSFKWLTANASATVLLASGPTWQVYEKPVGGYFPKANLCITHANKMFVAHTYENSVEYPNRLRWSHENSPENWYDDDYIDINAGGDGIRGLQIVDGQLLIFKPNSVFLLMGYDADNFQLVELSTILGIQNPQQCVAGDGGVYFFDYPRGLFFYDRNGIVDIFVRLRPILINDQVNPNATDEITCSYVNNRLWLSMPYSDSGTLPSYATINFIYDRTIGEFGAFTQFQTSDGRGLKSGIDWRDSTDTTFHLMGYTYYGTAKSFYMLSIDDYSYTQDKVINPSNELLQSQDFNTEYTTSWFYDDRYVQEKTFVGPDIVMKEVESQTEIRMNVYHDFDSTTQQRTQTIALNAISSGGIYGTSVYGTGTYGISTIGASIYEGSNLGRAKAVQLEFVGPTTAFTNTPGREWGLNSIAYKYKRRNIKG